MKIEAQPGPQSKFLGSKADVAVYGGAAGGGKSWALLAEPLRHVHNPHFGAVLFRRTSPEITKEGGLWDESAKLYPLVPGTEPRIQAMHWKFASGAKVGFGHMQYEHDKFSWRGSQIALIGFDQLETFTEGQFWYMFSRNRSVSGVRPYIRATANAEPGWLADLLSWWIDQDTGFPIAERAGVVRWFYRVDDQVKWYASNLEAMQAHPGLAADFNPTSFTFIPASVYDNKILLKQNPEYLNSMLNLPYIEQQRLLYGNWKVSSEGGEWPATYFPASIWFDEWPKDLTLKVIALDPSKGKSAKAGDYSAFVLLGRSKDGTLYVDADLERRPTERIVEDGFELFRKFPAHAFAVETNQFQELLANDFARISSARGIMLPLKGLNNSVNKEVRIRRLGTYLARGKFRFKAQSKGAALLVSQLREFPNAAHDDGADALEMAIRIGLWLLNGGDGDGDITKVGT